MNDEDYLRKLSAPLYRIENSRRNNRHQVECLESCGNLSKAHSVPPGQVVRFRLIWPVHAQ